MANVDEQSRYGGADGVREGFPENVMFEPNMMDVKKQVVGKKGKSSYAEGTANGKAFR